MGIGARWEARLRVAECFHWGKAFGPGAALEKYQSGNSAYPKILAMEVGWEVNGKVQGMSVSKNKPIRSHK